MITRLLRHTTAYCVTGSLASVLCLACLLGFNNPSEAWTPPPGEGMVANIDRVPADSYHPSPHLYIIEHAIRILASDGYENWADLAAQQLQDLANGARYADRAGQDIYLNWWVDVLFFFTVYEDSMRLCNSASLDHFYNPDEPNTSLGLNLQGWNALEKAGNWGKAISLLVTCLAGIPGLADVSGDVNPDFPNRGQSAVLLCQQKYDKAVAADKAGLFSDAMFNLGWACHALGDLSVVQHTYDSWITHEKYEDAADYKGNDPQFHAKTARPWSSPVVNYPEDLYAFVKAGVTPTQLAVSTAKYVHSIQQFKWAEGANATPGGVANEIARWATENGGPTDFYQALIRAIPVAERHTAALLARFMRDTGVPEKVPPVIGIVRDTSNRPVPGAYVFYCSRPNSNSDHTPWAYIRADDSGRFAFNFRPQFQYLIHAAMPGYTYRLQGKYVYHTPSGTQVQVLGPDASAWFVQKGGKVSNQMELVLEPLAKVATLIEPPKTTQPRMRPTRPVVGTTAPQIQPKPAAGVSQAAIAGLQPGSALPGLGNLKMRLRTEQPAPGAVAAAIVKPTSVLPLSKRTLSRKTAESLNEAMLEVKAIRKGLQFNALGQPIPGEPLKDMKLDVVVPMSDRDAERPYVLLQVSHLVGIASGEICKTPEEVIRAVDLAHSSLSSQRLTQADSARRAGASAAGATPTRPSAADGLERTRSHRAEQAGPERVTETAPTAAAFDPDSPQGRALKLIAASLPQTTVTRPNGAKAKAVKLPLSSAGQSGRTSLLANGVAPIPAQAGVKIEVRIVEAPGFLGPKPPGAPLILTTDAKGRAAFQLSPGGYPGKIRLLIRVVQDSKVDYRPQTSLDFFVYPYTAGDPVTASLPWLHEAAVVNL